MREPANDKNRLFHILEACDMLIAGKDKDTIEDIKNDYIKFYGYVKLVEIIGEATYKITKEFRAANPQIPWRMMEGMRHVLVHEYYRISTEKLWATIEHDIKDLRPLIEVLLKRS